MTSPPDIGYYSLHDINSYPCESGDDEKVQAASLCIDNAHGQSIWNVHLQPWKTEAEFWHLYETRYRVLLEKARAFLQMHAASSSKSRAAIFISAGFDASEWEGAGMQRHKVSVPTGFYARFTADIVALANEVGTGCEGRVISVLEGGYSDRALCSGVLSHLAGLCSRQGEVEAQGGLAGMMGGLSMNGGESGFAANGLSAGEDGERRREVKYDESWWSEASLIALEHRINPPPPPGVGKKLRTSGPQPTYATPTESFAYKVVNPTQFARSISGTMREAPPSASVQPERPTAPPVDWVTATLELRNLLVPKEHERIVRSCTAEELGGSKVPKKEKEKVEVGENGSAVLRQLRDRTGKKGVPATAAPPTTQTNGDFDDAGSVSGRSVSSASTSRGGSRRQTLHELPLAGVGTTKPVVAEKRRMSRRLSAGSALSSMSEGGFGGEEERPPMPPMPNSAVAPAALPSVGGGVQVKKTRVTPSVPTSTAGRMSVPPAGRNKIPPASLKTEVRTETKTPVLPSASAASLTNSTASGPLPPSANTNDNESVDALTAGMKRIALKVGSREEHDRKVKEREAAERRARALKGAETRRVNAAAKKAAAASSVAAATAGKSKELVGPGTGDLFNGRPEVKSDVPEGVMRMTDAASEPSGIAAVPVSNDLGMDMQETHADPTTTANGKAPNPHVVSGASSAPGPDLYANIRHQLDPDPYNGPAAPSSNPPAEVRPTSQPPVQQGILQPQPPVIPGPAPSNNIPPQAKIIPPSSPAQASRTVSTPTNNGPRNPPNTLPIWTSTGPIPFASSSSSPKQASSPRTASSSSAGGVMKSPRKSSGTPKWKHQRPEIGVDDGNGVSRSMLGGMMLGDGKDVEGQGQGGTIGESG